MIKSFPKDLWLFKNSYVIILTPLLLLPLPIIYNIPEARCAYILLIMAVYWVTEAAPLCVTALLPLFGLPLVGVMSSRAVSSFYVSESSMIFAGGLIVAVAIEHSNLHRRLAMFIIIKVGHSPRLLMAGFMLTTMLLSMWISNTGATAIMITVVEGILDVASEKNNYEDVAKDEAKGTHINSVPNVLNSNNLDIERNVGNSQLSLVDNHVERKPAGKILRNGIEMSCEEHLQLQQERNLKLRYGYYLSVAYAANIGGTGVITGTPPNLLLLGILSDSFTEPTGVNFYTWMLLNIPGMMICTFLSWAWLQYQYIGFRRGSPSDADSEDKKKINNLLQQEYKKLGPMTYQEKSVAFLFLLLIPLWIFRDPGFLYGWGTFLEDIYSIKIGDSVPVVLIVFLFLVLPSKNPFHLKEKDGVYSVQQSEGLLTWKLLEEKLAWGLIVLFGGGMAMAKAADASGLSSWIGGELSKLGGLPSPVFLLLITSLTTMITEILSNTATTAIVLPVLRELSLGLCINPLYFMIPATISASFAFMLPVATPPNAIVYNAGGIPSVEMMKTGFLMNVICIAAVNILVVTLGGPVFDIHNMPTWANSSVSGTLPNC